MSKKRAYLSGAITGIPYFLMVKKFREAQQELEAEGWEVVSPLDNGLPVESSWGTHLGRDLDMLATCDAIILLPCWINSTGAIMEKYFAHLKGIKVLAYNKPKKSKLQDDFDTNINEANGPL